MPVISQSRPQLVCYLIHQVVHAAVGVDRGATVQRSHHAGACPNGYLLSPVQHPPYLSLPLNIIGVSVDVGKSTPEFQPPGPWLADTLHDAGPGRYSYLVLAEQRSTVRRSTLWSIPRYRRVCPRPRRVWRFDGTLWAARLWAGRLPDVSRESFERLVVHRAELICMHADIPACPTLLLLYEALQCPWRRRLPARTGGHLG